MDWPLEDQIVTVIGLCDGNASLYTTSTFGVIGGIGHETVRVAAQNLVRVAEGLHDLAKPSAEYSYPRQGQIRFYLLTFHGVRVLEAEERKVSEGTDQLSELGDRAQRLITELRLVTETEETR